MKLDPNVPIWEQYERQFAKDTGLLAPGKDVPTAAANDPHYDPILRKHEWDRWLRRQFLKQKVEALFTSYSIAFEVDGRYSPDQWVEGVMALLDEELTRHQS